jgi:hypothetical protein
MTDLDDRLRDAGDALGEADAAATERARRAVLGAVGRPPRWRLAAAALAFAATVGAAFAIGYFVAPSGASDDVGAPSGASDDVGAPSGPGFLPAAGWETFQTGATSPPQAPSATAANVALGPDALSGTFPWETIGGLEPGDVLLHALFLPTGESAAVDEQFPPRELPLSLDDAQAGAQLEGQPAGVTALRLLARVNDVNVDVLVFFGGGEPTAEALSLAREELARLVVPQ